MEALCTLDAGRFRLPLVSAVRRLAQRPPPEAVLLVDGPGVVRGIAGAELLPGIVQAAYVMPDGHWGYGFPIGGVAAFDAEAGGVVSGGGVGFDISCGVRTLHTGLDRTAVLRVQESLAEALYYRIPVGVGSTGSVHLDRRGMDAMLSGGAAWAVREGYGSETDLERTEDGQGARHLPEQVLGPVVHSA